MAVNIRGRDIAYNPLVISYAVITHQRAMLFLGCNDLSLEQKDYFQSANIDIYAYDDRVTVGSFILSRIVGWV